MCQKRAIGKEHDFFLASSFDSFFLVSGFFEFEFNTFFRLISRRTDDLSRFSLINDDDFYISLLCEISAVPSKTTSTFYVIRKNKKASIVLINRPSH